MVSALRFLILALSVAPFAAPIYGQEVANWPAPATWSPHTAGRGFSTMGTIFSPLPFIALTPCRIADTRGNGFIGAYGPPALAGGTPRNFPLDGQCGIPAFVGTAGAVSLNITVTNTQGPGFLLIYPQGEAQPLVSTLNYVAGQTVANAAVVPLGTAGGVTVVAGVSGADLIIDTNGYYGGFHDPSNVFLGAGAGNTTTGGPFNTAVGSNSLSAITTGSDNTAIGHLALFSNTGGSENTASGASALGSNTDGFSNSAFGSLALNQNSTGNNNTACGLAALLDNTIGNYNVATGASALQSNTTGSTNTASGRTALFNNTTGSDNIAIGNAAGSNLTTGDGNIEIGNPGVAGESGTIRIGSGQTATFIAGISAAGVTGVPVLVSSSGQLGVASSSRCMKEEIREIAEESNGLMRLRPVAFRYKPEIDPTGLEQYGLIAEEVAEVFPNLVVFDKCGQPETVRYHLLVPMLLNEVQKDRKAIADLTARLERLETLMSPPSR